MDVFLCVMLLVVFAAAEESCVSFGRCGFALDDVTGELINATMCKRDHELTTNCTCEYNKGIECRYNATIMNMEGLRNVYKCMKPVTRCAKGKRCGHMYYGNVQVGHMECPEGYVVNEICECVKGRRKGEKCKYYGSPVTMYTGENASVLVEMLDCSLMMDTLSLPEGNLELNWTLTPEESELILAYSIMSEVNSYLSENFVYLFGECGNGEWNMNIGGRKIVGRVKRASRWSAEGNVKVSSECDSNGEAGRTSIDKLRKAAADRCKKSINSVKQKIRKECEEKVKLLNRELDVALKDKEEVEERLRTVNEELEAVKKELVAKRENVTRQHQLVEKIKGNVDKMYEEFQGLKDLIAKLEKACTSKDAEADLEFENYAESYEDGQTDENKDEEEETFEYISK